MAAKEGNIRLALSQTADRVQFSATVDVTLAASAIPSSLAPPSAAHMSPPTTLTPFPEGVRFLCIDDSLAAQRLFEFHVQRFCPGAVVRCFGATEKDVDRFLADALVGADVVVCDQNLDYPEGTYYGTDIIRSLHSLGFEGLLCIRSANDSEGDKANYVRSGIHCFLPKDLPGPKMVAELQASYLRLVQARGSLSFMSPPHSAPTHRPPSETLIVVGAADPSISHPHRPPPDASPTAPILTPRPSLAPPPSAIINSPGPPAPTK
jgi:hypothetical protein